MNRLLLGIVSVILIVVWVVWFFAGSEDNWTSMLASACIRVGLVTGAVWLAFPQVMQVLARAPVWMMGCMGVGLLAVLRWPKTALFVVPSMVALWVLRPRRLDRDKSKKTTA